MTEHEQHPSHMTLDRLALGLRTDGSDQAHVARCLRCTAHVARSRPLPAASPMPAWVSELEGASSAKAQGPHDEVARPVRWGAVATGLVALAAAALLVLRPQPDQVGPGAETTETTETAETAETAETVETVEYTTVRGAPAVGLYVKRGNRVTLWDGQVAVLPGDRLRLKVVAEGFRNVSVVTTDGFGGYTVLYESPVDPAGEHVLPSAWEVDDAPGDESLTVVLSLGPLDPNSMAAVMRGEAINEAVWLRRLTIPKAGQRQ